MTITNVSTATGRAMKAFGAGPDPRTSLPYTARLIGFYRKNCSLAMCNFLQRDLGLANFRIARNLETCPFHAVVT